MPQAEIAFPTPSIGNSLWVTESSYIVYKETLGGVSYTIAVDGSTGTVLTYGTHTATVIQVCVTALTTGGSIFIKAGLFIVETAIRLTNYITLEGEGEATILRQVSGGRFNIIENFDRTTTGNRGVVVRNLRIEGLYSEYANVNNSIDFYNPAPGSLEGRHYTIENVFLSASDRSAINLRSCIVNIVLVTIITTVMGIYCDDVYDSAFSNIIIGTANSYLIYLAAGGVNTFDDIFLGGNPGVVPSLYLLNERFDKFSNFHIDNCNRQAIKLGIGSIKNQFSDFIITKVSQEASGGYNAVDLDGSGGYPNQNNEFENFIICKLAAEANIPNHAFSETNTTDYNLYVNINAVDVTGNALNLVGVHDKYTNIIGGISIPAGAYKTMFFPAVGYGVGISLGTTHRGAQMTNGADLTGYSEFKVPADFHALGTIHPVIIAGASGDLYYRVITEYAADGELDTTHIGNTGFITLAVVVANIDELTDFGGTLGSLALGDYVGVGFGRDATNIADTSEADAIFLGVTLKYIPTKKTY